MSEKLSLDIETIMDSKCEEKVHELMLLTQTARDKIRKIEHDLETIESDSKPTYEHPNDHPPEGISGEEEVEWWNRRIAQLSSPIEGSQEKEIWLEEPSSKK